MQTNLQLYYSSRWWDPTNCGCCFSAIAVTISPGWWGDDRCSCHQWKVLTHCWTAHISCYRKETAAIWASCELTHSQRAEDIQNYKTLHADRIPFVTFMHFVRRIYPKGLPVNLRSCTFDQFMFSLGIRPMTSVLLLAPSVARYRHESLDTADMSCDVTLHLHHIAYNTLKGKKAKTNVLAALIKPLDLTGKWTTSCPRANAVQWTHLFFQAFSNWTFITNVNKTLKH